MKIPLVLSLCLMVSVAMSELLFSATPAPQAAPVAAIAPAPTPAAPVAEVPRPKWPMALDLDDKKKNSPIIHSRQSKIAQDFYKESQGYLKQVADLMKQLEDLKKNIFGAYLKTQKLVKDFVIDANSKLGTIREL